MLGRSTSCGVDALKSHLPHGFPNWTASPIPLCLISNIDKESAHQSFVGKSKQVNISSAWDSVQMLILCGSGQHIVFSQDAMGVKPGFPSPA